MPAAVPAPIGLLLAAWIVFVVYGSLVPLDFRTVTLYEAWSRLVHAPMLNIGAGGRADWIANGVLYLPVGFLGTTWLMGSGPWAGARRTGAWLGSLLFGGLLALTVEFTQAFFPPRTVSRNDLLAESIGTALGALGALAGARGFRTLLSTLGVGGTLLPRLFAPAYALAYAGYSMFPFDLVLSVGEWTGKLQSGQVAWLWVHGHAEQGWARGTAKILVEVAAVAPIGAWWASRVKPGLQANRLAVPAAVLGLALGTAIEVAQLLILTGLSQGASVLTRGLGFAGGAWLWARWGTLHVEAVRAGLRRATGPLLLLYGPLLTVHFGWWRGPWMTVPDALQRLHDEIRFVPLYYHYYTTEANALVSLASVFSAYAMLGMLSWAWHLGAVPAAVLSAGLALVIESGRLMAASTKPDPSNLLIAAVAAWVAHHICQRLMSGRGSLRRSV